MAEVKFVNVASPEMTKMCAELAKTLQTIVPYEGELEGKPMPPEVLQTRLSILLFTAVSGAKFYEQPLEFLIHNVETVYNGIMTPHQFYDTKTKH